MAEGVRFIRVRGRVVPIKPKKPRDSHYGKLAAGGFIAQTAMRVGRQPGGLKNPKAVIAGGLIATGVGVASLINSYEHGKSKKSFWSGIGRHFNNALAISAGGIAGAVGARIYTIPAPSISGIASKVQKLKLAYKIKKSGLRVVK